MAQLAQQMAYLKVSKAAPFITGSLLPGVERWAMPADNEAYEALTLEIFPLTKSLLVVDNVDSDAKPPATREFLMTILEKLLQNIKLNSLVLTEYLATEGSLEASLRIGLHYLHKHEKKSVFSAFSTKLRNAVTDTIPGQLSYVDWVVMLFKTHMEKELRDLHAKKIAMKGSSGSSEKLLGVRKNEIQFSDVVYLLPFKNMVQVGTLLEKNSFENSSGSSSGEGAATNTASSQSNNTPLDVQMLNKLDSLKDVSIWLGLCEAIAKAAKNQTVVCGDTDRFANISGGGIKSGKGVSILSSSTALNVTSGGNLTPQGTALGGSRRASINTPKGPISNSIFSLLPSQLHTLLPSEAALNNAGKLFFARWMKASVESLDNGMVDFEDSIVDQNNIPLSWLTDNVITQDDRYVFEFVLCDENFVEI